MKIHPTPPPLPVRPKFNYYPLIYLGILEILQISIELLLQMLNDMPQSTSKGPTSALLDLILAIAFFPGTASYILFVAFFFAMAEALASWHVFFPPGSDRNFMLSAVFVSLNLVLAWRATRARKLSLTAAWFIAILATSYLIGTIQALLHPVSKIIIVIYQQ